MKIATLDIGTNTVLLLIAETSPGTSNRLIVVEEHAEIARLGEGVDKTGELSAAAIERVLEILARYATRIEAQGVDKVAAIGTQALREVRNGAAFLERARAILGCEVEVISGDREAALSWLATARSLPSGAGTRRTVVDIGGGSTEILVGGAQVERGVSVPIGSVRLTERCIAHDPPTEEEKRALVRQIDEALAAAPTPEGELVGIAGTVTTLCAIHLGMTDYDGERVHGLTMKRAEVENVVDGLGRMPVADRRRTPGLHPKRADVIYAGGVILLRLMAKGGIEALTVSDRGIRWGLAYELAGEPTSATGPTPA